MSCVFVITPFVVGNWATLSALIGATAANFGFRLIKSAGKSSTEMESLSGNAVDLEIENSEVMTDQLRRGESIQFYKEEIKLTVSQDAMGRLKAAVSGPENISKEYLTKIGQEFLNNIIQQYAYQRVVNELKNKGFAVIEEQKEQDGRIRMMVRKFE